MERHRQYGRSRASSLRMRVAADLEGSATGIIEERHRWNVGIAEPVTTSTQSAQDQKNREIHPKGKEKTEKVSEWKGEYKGKKGDWNKPEWKPDWKPAWTPGEWKGKGDKAGGKGAEKGGYKGKGKTDEIKTAVKLAIEAEKIEKASKKEA